MIGSLILYFGLVLALAGLALVVRPVRRLGVATRGCALLVLGAGLILGAVALFLPASESRAEPVATRLDAFAPVWQFREFHSLRIAAPPEAVYEAIRRVRADEIALFRALTWIRRGGRELPPGILNAGGSDSLIEVATRGGFVQLADEAPRELVIGTAVVRPPGDRTALTRETYAQEQEPGFALGTMNFLVRADGIGGSLVSTETRVYANNAAARRRFAAYWRIIYPGSALIRRMWLRAIARRALD